MLCLFFPFLFSFSFYGGIRILFILNLASRQKSLKLWSTRNVNATLEERRNQTETRPPPPFPSLGQSETACGWGLTLRTLATRPDGPAEGRETRVSLGHGCRFPATAASGHPTTGVNARSQGPLHATLFLSTGAHSPGPSLIPLPGPGRPLGPTGHPHRSKQLLHYQHGNPWGERTGLGRHRRGPRMDHQVLWTATLGQARRRLQGRAHLGEPPHGATPCRQRPMEPTGVWHLGSSLTSGAQGNEAANSTGTAFGGTTLRLEISETKVSRVPFQNRSCRRVLAHRQLSRGEGGNVGKG